MRKRAAGLIFSGISALFFLEETAGAAEIEELNAAFLGYAAKMIVALLLLGAFAYLALKFLPRRLGSASRSHIKIIGAVNLGRDTLYISRLGPEVVAFLSGRAGSVVLGRWSAEEWDDYEAARMTPESLKLEKKPGEKSR
ncbi:MAG: hypothetical protein LBU13_05815 [Synergistaceae bacterium]|jgi:hypothetical protein|nr:hypothetical protein [Synergistaceae bacterium]